jgi:hypothetical protein
MPNELDDLADAFAEGLAALAEQAARSIGSMLVEGLIDIIFGGGEE